MDLKKYIRDIPDFPKEGIIFKDITTLLKEGPAFREVLNIMEKNYYGKQIDKIVGIESRGFFFGGALADRMNCGLVLARKPGKLPAETIRESYALEYGTNTLEMHKDSISKGENIFIVDDLLATGGTARAVMNLVNRLGGNIIGLEFLIELSFLNGRDKLAEQSINSIIKY
jgi:adenine phosphoribosyltransferase